MNFLQRRAAFIATILLLAAPAGARANSIFEFSFGSGPTLVTGLITFSSITGCTLASGNVCSADDVSVTTAPGGFTLGSYNNPYNNNSPQWFTVDAGEISSATYYGSRQPVSICQDSFTCEALILLYNYTRFDGTRLDVGGINIGCEV
jgi:hypothetical protein